MFQNKYALTFTLIHMLMFSYMEHQGMSMNVMFRQIFWHSKHVQLSAKGIFWPVSLGEFHELSRYPLFVSHFFALPYFWPLSSLSFHLNLLQESVPTSGGSPESGFIAPELVVVSPCHRRCLKQLACRIKQHQAASNFPWGKVSAFLWRFYAKASHGKDIRKHRKQSAGKRCHATTRLRVKIKNEIVRK